MRAWLIATISLAACTDKPHDSSSPTDSETDADTDTDADADTDTDTDTDIGAFYTIGTLITASWTGDKKIFELIDFWQMSGTYTDCSGCLYSWGADFSGMKTGASFSAEIVINPIDGYPGYGYTYADDDFWGIAFDYYDHVITSNYGIYLYSGTTAAPYLYQGYFYLY